MGAAIDRLRGDVARTVWIKRAISERLDLTLMGGVAPSPIPAGSVAERPTSAERALHNAGPVDRGSPVMGYSEPATIAPGKARIHSPNCKCPVCVPPK